VVNVTCVAKTVLLIVEVLTLVTMLVLVAGETAREHAEEMTAAGYLLRTDGRLMSRLLKVPGAAVTVDVTTVVVGMLSVVVETVVVKRRVVLAEVVDVMVVRTTSVLISVVGTVDVIVATTTSVMVVVVASM
jgi:hypothetical protein